MRSDSVKNMSAYADQNHAPSLAVARLELLALTLYSCDGLSTMLTFLQVSLMILQTITVHDKYKGDFFTFLENDTPPFIFTVR